MTTRSPPSFPAASPLAARRCAVSVALLLASCGASQLHPPPEDARLAAARKASPEGARVFNLRCAPCHGELGNAPDVQPVMGPAARLLGEGRPDADALLLYLRRTMPPDPRARAALSPEDHAAVAEYLLRVAGARE